MWRPSLTKVLTHAVLHKIAFEYYPLDLSATSNPFLVSWWPLALGDPALFHVSLQTACLDEELLAQKGFQSSEILMADSVALLRRKVQDTSLAIQDGTMNSVITLAAIEVRLISRPRAAVHSAPPPPLRTPRNPSLTETTPFPPVTSSARETLPSATCTSTASRSWST